MEQRVFSEFDAYEAAIQHADIQMTLRRREQSKWVVGAMQLKNLHLQWGASGGSMVTLGQIAPGGHALFIPLNRFSVNTVNGQRLDEGTAMIAASGSEFCIGADGWNEWFSLFVPQAFEADDKNCVEVKLPTRVRVMSFGRRRLNHIRRLVKAVVESFGENDAARQAQVRAAERALHKLVSCSTSITEKPTVRGRGRPPVNRQEILRMLESLASRPDKPSGVSQLSGSMDVSERTLRRVFRDWLGTTPARYAKLRRLHRLRDALLAADPADTTVSAVLTRSGILEFGRFAGAYRTLFGELPSQTLHRCVLSASRKRPGPPMSP